MKILIVDDEQEALVALKRLFNRRGLTIVDTASNGTEAIEKLKTGNYDIVLLDLLMPDYHGLEVLEQAKPYSPETEFIILTAVDDVAQAVKAVKMGAYDYLIKPAEPERIFLSVDRAFERKGLIYGLNSNKKNNFEKLLPAFESIKTNSQKMKEILNYTAIMAKSGNPILITGESGTGKELLAKAIHKISMPENSPFVAVNVASIPENLFESQFFGHKKGAFTGALNDFKGYFEQANGGTLFLDEIGDLPLNQQSKFLRVLEDKIITPIGDSKQITVSIRIISATNSDIFEMCKTGKFRLDLLYRLKSVNVNLPPLRERDEDIVFLSDYFLKKNMQKYSKNNLRFSADALDYLRTQKFEGNIRELSQIIENAVLLCSGTVISISNLKGEIAINKTEKPKYLTIKENSLRYIEHILEQTNWEKAEAAKILGISLRQLQRKIAELKKE